MLSYSYVQKTNELFNLSHLFWHIPASSTPLAQPSQPTKYQSAIPNLTHNLAFAEGALKATRNKPQSGTPDPKHPCNPDSFLSGRKRLPMIHPAERREGAQKEI
jgi:hypothetical protein